MEPGASVVLTHGLAFRPFLFALRASRPAASMTLGLEVLVQEVIAAMATAPWSIVKSRPSASVTAVGLEAEAGAWLTCTCENSCAESSSWAVKPIGSEAGKVPSTAASTRECASPA